jgi:CheY-like chemotaxis protein
MLTHNTQPGNPHWQVLVVEDHEETALLLRTLLEDEGYEVSRAVRAEEAISACCVAPTANAKDQPPRFDLVLLDLNLPGMEYTEMVRRIADCPRTASPVIVLSAMPDKHVQAAARDIGAAAVVRKPFSLDVLIATVDKILTLSPTTWAPARSHDPPSQSEQ